MKRYHPYKIIKYLLFEFVKCLSMIFLIFLSLSLLTNFVEEIVFFKEKDVSNLVFKTVYLTILKTPNTLIETSIFIFLFSGIFYFVQLLKNNEINTIKLSGLSNFITIFTPSIFSFFLGFLIIFFISPISATSLQIYEKNKRAYSNNDNLIIINDSGLWFMENYKEKFRIIRADKIANNDFSKLYNSSIYELDKNFNFLERFDSRLIFINGENWFLEEVNKIDQKNIENKKIKEMKLISTIDMNELKNLFTNVNTISFLDIFNNIKILKKRGYSGEELKIKFHKYLSLPFYLLAMITLSTLFTLNINKNLNNFIYIFLGIISGIIIYFLNDLSIAIGLSNKIPLELSVWIPIFLILVISLFNLLKSNENYY